MRLPPSILSLAIGLAAGMALGAEAGRAEEGPRPVSVWTRDRVVSVLHGRWSRLRTPHFRVFTDRGASLDAVELRGLEADFRDISEQLKLLSSALDSLRQHPILLFYTQRSEVVGRLAGMPAEGVSFPEFGIIVTARLPHAHEVAHILAYAATGSGEARTAPILQEGLATWLGGTVDASPEVELAAGLKAVRSRGIDLREFLTPRAFHESSLDQHDRYAIAALFCDFLIESYGWADLRGLYHLLAADARELERRPAGAVALQFEGWTGRSWDRLVGEFRRWSWSVQRGGIRIEEGEFEASGVRREGDLEVGWGWEDGDLVVDFRSLEGWAVDAEMLWGPLLTSPVDVDAEQPAWRRWGLRVRPEGAELTDHRRRRSLAVSIETPDSPERWRLRLDSEVLEGVEAPEDVLLFVTPRFDPGISAERDD